jgi:hypothetical protein
MKVALFIIITCSLYACNESSRSSLQSRKIDSLESQLASTYKPGFGEFMLAIQAHHSKLWFAGKNNNWKLADFEVHEIMELIEDIQKFQSERPEAEKIVMIQPAIDSVNKAIVQKDRHLFISSFILLTNTCNNCHHAVNFEFNVVKVPDTSPFSNQDFRVGDTVR